MTAAKFLPLRPTAFHILVSLAGFDRHGYSIMREVAERTEGKVQLQAGTLYASIKRLVAEGLIEELAERPDPDEDDQRRRYYRLSDLGRQVARAETARLAELVSQAESVGLYPGGTPRARRPPLGLPAPGPRRG